MWSSFRLAGDMEVLGNQSCFQVHQLRSPQDLHWNVRIQTFNSSACGVPTEAR